MVGHDRIVAYGALIVGLMAAIAAGAQTWVSWKSSDDFRKSVLMSRVMEECSPYAAGVAFPRDDPATQVKPADPVDVLSQYLGRLQRMIWVAKLMKPIKPEVADRLGSKAGKQLQEALKLPAVIDDAATQAWMLNMVFTEKDLGISCSEFFD